MTAPLVSVLMPVCNAEPYIGAALGSIVRQDHRNLEIIIIDDGSTDGSLPIVERFGKTDRRIKVISRENRGLIATLNEGLSMVHGDFVARMDADDIAYPSRLSRQVACFAGDPELAVCGTATDVLVGERLVRGTPDPIFQTCDLGVLSMFFTVFIHSTVVFNRKLIPGELLTYDTRYPHAEDFDLFRRITMRFPAKMLADRLVAYRSHEGSVTNRHKHQMRQTHLAIVAENLVRGALVDDVTPLRDIGDAVTVETVRGAAELIQALEAAICEQPKAMRDSYEAGALNLFYFLYQLVGDERQPQLTHEFLTRTGRWGSIRRREQWALRFGARAPRASLVSIFANRQIDAISRYLQSEPAAAALRAT